MIGMATMKKKWDLLFSVSGLFGVTRIDLRLEYLMVVVVLILCIGFGVECGMLPHLMSDVCLAYCT